MVLLIMRLFKPIASLVNRTGHWSTTTVVLQSAYSRVHLWPTREIDLWRGSCVCRLQAILGLVM
jgi:hypothetical protein